MKICVCGWYFYPEFMKQLKQVSRKYPVAVVAHKQQEIDLPHVYTPNVGLEWGAYNHYLMRFYDGKDKVLFIHDDMEVYDLKFFDDINDSKLDVGFVFRNESESKWAFGAHGRAIIMSEKFLNYTKSKKFKMRVKD